MWPAHDKVHSESATDIATLPTDPEPSEPAEIPTVTAWAYDTQWAEVTSCWGYAPALPTVIVRNDCRMDRSPQDFYDEWGRWVTGYALGNQLNVCPDLRALKHEMSEYVCTAAGYGCKNTSGGCFDVGVM
jgi:hypothetical protein